MSTTHMTEGDYSDCQWPDFAGSNGHGCWLLQLPLLSDSCYGAVRPTLCSNATMRRCIRRQGSGSRLISIIFPFSYVNTDTPRDEHDERPTIQTEAANLYSQHRQLSRLGRRPRAWSLGLIPSSKTQSQPAPVFGDQGKVYFR